MEGTRGPLTVAIEARGDAVQISATGFGHDVHCLPRNQFGSELVPEPDVKVGDPEFDAAVVLRGSEASIRALLNQETRRALRLMLSGQLRFQADAGTEVLSVVGQVKASGLQLTVPRDGRDLFADAKHPGLPPTALRPVVDLAERLVRPEDLAQRIADNTVSEPIAAIRIGNLKVLASEFPDHPATRAALVAALDDPADEVRLEGARTQGDAGVRTLLKIALGPASQDAHAAEAIALSGDRFTSRHARWALRRAIPARRRLVVKACLERLVTVDDARTVSAVAAALWSEDDEVALAASRALAEARAPGFEEMLIAALEHRLNDVQLQAVAALGRIGSVVAVAPLVDWADRHALDRWVRGDARQAIARIQSRLPGASPGQLSLAGGEAGQVSLVEEDQRGRVSLEKSRSG